MWRKIVQKSPNITYWVYYVEDKLQEQGRANSSDFNGGGIWWGTVMFYGSEYYKSFQTEAEAKDWVEREIKKGYR